MHKKRIGILTSGGDCPSLNAMSRDIVRAADKLGRGVVGFRDGFARLLPPGDTVVLVKETTAGIMSIRTTACSTCPLPTTYIGCVVSNSRCDPMHSSAPEIAGGGLANPTALILTGALLLRHLYLNKKMVHIEQAVRSVIERHRATTRDLGVHATTKVFTHAVFAALNEPAKESLAPLLARTAA